MSIIGLILVQSWQLLLPCLYGRVKQMKFEREYSITMTIVACILLVCNGFLLYKCANLQDDVMNLNIDNFILRGNAKDET